MLVFKGFKAMVTWCIPNIPISRSLPCHFQEDCEGDPGLGSCDILSAVFNTDIDFIEDEQHRSEKGIR